MRVNQLFVRCYAERIHDQWQALCIDLNIAAQADSFEEVKVKLDQMVSSYVYDALVGEDKAHAEDLLDRKADFRYRAKYHVYSFLAKRRAALSAAASSAAYLKDHVRVATASRKVFKEVLPMSPRMSCAA